MNEPGTPAAHDAVPRDAGLYPDGPFWHGLLYRGSHAATTALMTLAFSLRTEGMRHVPMRGPALLVANHQSFLDPPLIGAAARRELVYLARKTLFRNAFFAGLIRAYNAVPIDQDGIGKDGIRTILEQLQLGRAVLVFPEGERTHDGTMLPFKPGIQLLIKKTQAPIVPVGIAGAYHAWPRWRSYPIPAPICAPAAPGNVAVVIGAARDSRRYAELPRAQALSELLAEIDVVRRRAEQLRRRT